MEVSLLGGWLPAVVTIVAWCALVSGIAWWRRAARHWMVLAVGALAAATTVAWVVVPSGVGISYPGSFILWGALPVFALGAALVQWRFVAWWRTTVALLAVPALAAFGALQVNAHYAYLPTLGDLFGAPFPGQVAAHGLDGLTANLSMSTP